MPPPPPAEPPSSRCRSRPRAALHRSPLRRAQPTPLPGVLVLRGIEPAAAELRSWLCQIPDVRRIWLRHCCGCGEGAWLCQSTAPTCRSTQELACDRRPTPRWQPDPVPWTEPGRGSPRLASRAPACARRERRHPRGEEPVAMALQSGGRRRYHHPRAKREAKSSKVPQTLTGTTMPTMTAAAAAVAAGELPSLLAELAQQSSALPSAEEPWMTPLAEVPSAQGPASRWRRTGADSAARRQSQMPRRAVWRRSGAGRPPTRTLGSAAARRCRWIF